MTFNSTKLSMAIKSDLEQRDFISNKYTLSILSKKGIEIEADAAKRMKDHRVDKKTHNTNAAEMLWSLVDKASPDVIHKGVKKNSFKKKIENFEEGFDFSDNNLNSFNRKMEVLSSPEAAAYNFLSELWDFRQTLLRALVISGKNVKGTLSVLDQILAKEFGIDRATLALWTHKINKVFIQNIYDKERDLALKEKQLTLLLSVDPFRISVEGFLKNLTTSLPLLTPKEEKNKPFSEDFKNSDEEVNESESEEEDWDKELGFSTNEDNSTLGALRGGLTFFSSYPDGSIQSPGPLNNGSSVKFRS